MELLPSHASAVLAAGAVPRPECILRCSFASGSGSV
jgi:hypothetical protein